MKSTSLLAPDEKPEGPDMAAAVPLVLPGVVSACCVLMALLSLAGLQPGARALPWLAWLQTALLMVAGGVQAAVAHGRLSHWEDRVAPVRALARVRADLLRRLRHNALAGLGGPLLLALVVGWQDGDARPMVAALAAPGLGLASGFCVVSAWLGRAPRWLLPPALASVLVLLGLPDALVKSGALALLAGAFAAGALWLGVLAPQALAVRGPALALPTLGAWWRRVGAYRRWAQVPFLRTAKTSGAAGNGLSAWFPLVICMPQFAVKPQGLRYLAWGEAYTPEYAAATYAVWLTVLACLGYGWLVAPRLHWRYRLIPTGLAPLRWARRLVLGSMLAGVLLVSLGIALSLLGSWVFSKPSYAHAWPAAASDVALAIAFAAWLRARHEHRLWLVAVLMLGFGLAVAGVVTVLLQLGWAPQRTGLNLLLQWAVVLPLTWAAIRAWSRRDLNQLS